MAFCRPICGELLCSSLLHNLVSRLLTNWVRGRPAFSDTLVRYPWLRRPNLRSSWSARCDRRRLDQRSPPLGHEVEAALEKQMPNARSMATSGKGTGTVGYNVQTVVDSQHHLIADHQITRSPTSATIAASRR